MEEIFFFFKDFMILRICLTVILGNVFTSFNASKVKNLKCQKC